MLTWLSIIFHSLGTCVIISLYRKMIFYIKINYFDMLYIKIKYLFYSFIDVFVFFDAGAYGIKRKLDDHG